MLKAAWYYFARAMFAVMVFVWFRCRFYGREHIPKTGALIVVCNHQSNADPVFVGVGCTRRLSYFAKKSLFVGPFSWAIKSLDAIPIDRIGFSLDTIKQTLKRLKAGGGVAIFPEGARSEDGKLRPLKPGFAFMARRGKAVIVPMAVSGAFEAWPRSQRFPRPKKVIAQFGPIIDLETVEKLTDDELLHLVQQRLTECLNQADKRRTGQS